MITILFIAVGLSMDVFAVSISSGLMVKNIKISSALRMALLFGFFHIIMLMTGWFSGLSFRDYIAELDHWIGFGLLCFVGIKMIYESLQIEKKEKPANPLDAWILFMLAVATSIDALAVGLSFALLNLMIVYAVIIIGTMVFILSMTGVFIGSKVGHFFESKIEIAGGIILIIIGFKFLIEHLIYHI